MDFGVLGPLRVTGPAGQVDVAGAKERTLLARLVAAGGQVVPAADLVDALWPEEPPRTAAKSLQTYVLRVRNAVEPDRDGPPRLLVTDGPGYRLAAAPESVDAERFTRLSALGRRLLADDRAPDAAPLLQQALELWRGPAYAGFEDTGFGRSEGRRLEELRVAVREDLCAARLRSGRHGEAVGELERLVAEHPYRERSWGLLVQALYAADRQADALAAYERARTLLADELGIDPGPDLTALRDRVLAQDPALRSGGRPAVPASLAGRDGALVGRGPELARLTAAWRRARAGEPVTVVVRGPAGAGATRLAAELADEVARTGAAVQVHEATASPPETGLLVVEGGDPPPPSPGRLDLVLAAPSALPVGGAEVVDLRPLDPVSAREVVAEYVRPEHVEQALPVVLAASGGWPGRLHAEALRWARERVSAEVGAAAAVAGASAARLAHARDEVRDGVVALSETAPDRPTADRDRCPWRGLAAYDVGDAPWFAGRERLVAELVARVASGRLLAVVGASGSGKSSLVRAGLLGALADGVLPGSDTWSQVVVRPGAHPMSELAHRALGAASARHDDVGDLLERLVRTGAPPAERVVLVVDQLEEVWTTCADPGERAAFLDALAALAADPASPVTVVLAVRADYVGGLAERAALAERLSDATVLVGSPDPAEVRRAVELPAARAGLALDVGLADAVVEDAGREPGLLPLLSTCLMRLWEHRDGGRLTLAAYVRGGGLSGAIARLADEALDALPDDDRRAARVLLLRLAGQGEGAALVRRRVPLPELAALPDPRVRQVVEPLVAARLLTASDGHVEVAHEALFREWPRLRAWLEEDTAGRAVQLRLAQAASDWEREERDPALLWRGARLASALDVARERPEEVTSAEVAFLAASSEAHDAERRLAEERAAAATRSNRRLRGLLGGLAVLLVVALVAGVVAQRSRRDAEAASASAEARRLAATAVNEDYLDRALLSAVEAVRAERSPETYGALLTLLTRVPEIVTQVRTTERFLAAGTSTDGSAVFLGENVPVLRAVDAVSGAQRWRRDDLPGQPWGLHPDDRGRLLVTTSGEPGAVLALDGADGTDLWRVDADALAAPGEPPPLLVALGWRPDGTAVLATDLAVLVVDGATGDVLREVPLPEPGPPDFALLWPDGRVSLAPPEQEPFVLDLDDAAATPLPAVVHAVSPDGQLVATVEDLVLPEVQVRLLDAATLAPVGDPVRLPGFHGAATWSPEGDLLAVGAGQELAVLDGRSGALRSRSTGHSGAVMGAVFTGEDRRTVWTAGRDGTAIAWDLTGGRRTLRSGTAEVGGYVGSVSADGAVAVVAQFHEDRLNDAHLVDPATGRRVGDGPLATPDGCACQVGAVAMAPDGSTAYGVMDEWSGTLEQPEPPPFEDRGHLVAWDVPSGRVRDVVRLAWPAYGLDLTPDGRRAVVAGRGGTAVVDLERMAVAATVEDAAPMGQPPVPGIVEVGPGGDVAVVGRSPEDGPGRVLLVDTRTAETRADVVLPDGDGLLSAAWSADGRQVAVGGFRGTVRVLDGQDLTPASPTRTVTGGFVQDLETSPDGRFVASLGSDGDLLLWDAATWRPMGTPLTDGLGWGWLHFTPGGEQLRFTGTDGEPAPTVALPVDPEQWVRDACRVAGRELTADEWAVVRPGVAQRPTCG